MLQTTQLERIFIHKENGQEVQCGLNDNTEMKNAMEITDLDGKVLTVTDCTLALMQADDYRHYRVSEPSPDQLHLYDYWEDLYQKLLLLDGKIKGDKDIL